MSNDYTKKCSHILLAYIVWMVAAVVFFCALRWLFWSKLAMPWSENAWAFGFPLVIGGLITFLAMRRRWKILLPFNHWRHDRIPSMAMLLTSVITLMLVNHYMKISSPTIAVEKVTEIKQAPDEIYYTINHFALRKDVLKSSICYNHSRRTVRIECFFVMPFEDSELNYWYGVKYTHPNSFLSNENVLDKEADAFYKSCLSQFQSSAPQSAVHFEKITASDDLDNYRNAIASAVGLVKADRTIILQPILPQDEPNVQSQFYWIFGAFAIGVILLLIILAFTNLDMREYEHQTKQRTRE